MSRFLVLVFFLTCGMSLFLTSGIIAQNAPITTAATITGAVPGPVSVPISVINFSNIGAISLTIDYNYSVIHFVQGTPNSALSTFAIGDADLGNGNHRVTMGWYGPGTSLSNGSVIMTLLFTYISGSTTLSWFDNGPTCEYADASFTVLNDIPQSTYYINGYVCGALQNPGIISGDSSVCSGQAGVYYSIAPVPGASGYAWTVPPGAIITGGGNITWILADYPTGSSSGNVTVASVNFCGTGPSSQLPVTVNPLPVANAGNDTTIPYGTSTTLHAASGGTGSFGYHWTPEYLLVDAYVQNPQTVLLTSTNIFTVTVTNLTTQCQNSDQVVVSVSGGPLSVNPQADPDSVCKGNSSQLYANAGGGSGSYSYQWSCIPPGSPPWTSTLPNPLVIPDTTTTYLLAVFDGFNTINGSVIVTVNPVPGTPFIQLDNYILQSDTCCGNQWYFNGSLIPGATAQTYATQVEGQYFDIVTINGCSSDTSNIIDVITGIRIARQPSFEVFPNPARDFLFIKAKEKGILKIQVYSSEGIMIRTENISSWDPSQTITIDIRNIASGIYILKVISESSSFTRRIVIW